MELKQARDPRGKETVVPILVKAEPKVPLVNTKLPTEQAPSVTDTISFRRVQSTLILLNICIEFLHTFDSSLPDQEEHVEDRNVLKGAV